MPSTHLRRRRDSTVELSRVGIGGVNMGLTETLLSLWKEFVYDVDDHRKKDDRPIR